MMFGLRMTSPKFVTFLLGAIPRMNNILNEHSISGQSMCMYDVNRPQFGLIRLRLVEVVATLVEVQDKDINKALLNNSIFKTMIEIFLMYEDHSLMQLIVSSIFNSILTRELNSEEDNVMKLAVLKQCTLLRRIVDANNISIECARAPKGIRKPYMAQLMRIANTVCTLFTTLSNAGGGGSNEAVKDILMLADDNQDWKSFVDHDLQEINNNNDTPLNVFSGEVEVAFDGPSISNEVDDMFKSNDDIECRVERDHTLLDVNKEYDQFDDDWASEFKSNNIRSESKSNRHLWNEPIHSDSPARPSNSKRNNPWDDEEDSEQAKFDSFWFDNETRLVYICNRMHICLNVGKCFVRVL